MSTAAVPHSSVASAQSAGAPEALIRNIVMRRLGGQRLLERFDWLYGWTPPVFEFAHRYVTQLAGEDAEER